MGSCTGDSFMQETESSDDEAVTDSPFNILKQLKLK
jgi:uncharacterized metal-binding protein YceD (DUF177 family)